MFEIKLNIKIDAPQIAEAINNLAKALSFPGQLTATQEATATTSTSVQPQTEQTAPVTPVVAPTPQVNPQPTPVAAPAPQPVATQPTAQSNVTSQPVAVQTVPTSDATPVAVPQPTMQPTPVPITPPAPTSPATTQPISTVPIAQAPQYAIEQIQLAGGAFVGNDSSKMIILQNLLAQFGVQAVTQLKPEQLGAFATAMRRLGAQI